jgi:hypothetical protein
LIIEILPIKISQIPWEIDPVFTLQLSGSATVFRQITTASGIFKAEGNRITVGLGEKEFQGVVPKGILNGIV